MFLGTGTVAGNCKYYNLNIHWIKRSQRKLLQKLMRCLDAKIAEILWKKEMIKQ